MLEDNQLIVPLFRRVWRRFITPIRATVQSRCPGPGFDGSWGVRADGQGRYFGSFSADEGGRVQRGQLWVQVQTGRADTLQVQVHDADGQLLWGPLDLRRAAADTSACR